MTDSKELYQKLVKYFYHESTEFIDTEGGAL